MIYKGFLGAPRGIRTHDLLIRREFTRSGADREERETVAELKKEIERLKRQNERRIKPAASQKIIIRDKPNSPAKNNDLTFLIALLVGVGAVVAQVLTFLFCF